MNCQHQLASLVTVPLWNQILQLQSILMTAALVTSQLSIFSGHPGLEPPSLAVPEFMTHTNSEFDKCSLLSNFEVFLKYSSYI